MAQALIKPEMLRWAIDRSGLSVDKLAEKYPKLQDWLDDKAKPSFSQLSDLAKRTLTPLGYFYLASPPADELPVTDFRTKDDDHVRRMSIELITTIKDVRARQEWYSEYLRANGCVPLPIVNSVKIGTPINEVSRKIHNFLGLPELWTLKEQNWETALNSLRNAIDDSGILVAVNGITGLNTHRPLDPNEFRGFVLIDSYAPVIFVNGADAKAAQMFTIIHELAHVFLGQAAVIDLDGMQPANFDVEIYCNKVAAEFLVPADYLREQWPILRRYELSEAMTIASRQLKVSSIVVARRALDLALITTDEFFDYYRQCVVLWQKDDSSGGDFYRNHFVRLGRRFAKALASATKEGTISLRDAYRLAGISGKTFHTFADEAYEFLRSEPR